MNYFIHHPAYKDNSKHWSTEMLIGKNRLHVCKRYDCFRYQVVVPVNSSSTSFLS